MHGAICRCVDCSNGEAAASYTDDFRHACEVRMLAAMETDARRTLYLEGVRAERGVEAYRRLRRDTWLAMGGGKE